MKACSVDTFQFMNVSVRDDHVLPFTLAFAYHQNIDRESTYASKEWQSDIILNSYSEKFWQSNRPTKKIFAATALLYVSEN